MKDGKEEEVNVDFISEKLRPKECESENI